MSIRASLVLSVLLARQVGIPEVVVFVNKVDLVDDPELIDLVELETRDLLTRHGFDGAAVPFRTAAPIVPQAELSDGHRTYRCYLRGPDGIRGLSLCGPGARNRSYRLRRGGSTDRSDLFALLLALPLLLVHTPTGCGRLPRKSQSYRSKDSALPGTLSRGARHPRRG